LSTRQVQERVDPDLARGLQQTRSRASVIGQRHLRAPR